MDLLHNFSDKWKEIGLILGFTQPELNQIKSDPSLYMSGAPASFLTKLLSQWVQWPTVDHPTKPTLGALCEALRSSLVGLGSLAKKVEREMNYSTTGKAIRVLCSASCCNHIKVLNDAAFSCVCLLFNATPFTCS